VPSLMNHHLAKKPETSGPPSILITDDDSFCREILRVFLESYGFHCLEAQDGGEALAIVRTSAICFMVTDFHMPYMNGCELLEQLCREDCSRPPTVLVTGDLTDQIQQRALQTGAITVLEKPFDQKNLLNIICRSMDISNVSPGKTISALATLPNALS